METKEKRKTKKIQTSLKSKSAPTLTSAGCGRLIIAYGGREMSVFTSEGAIGLRCRQSLGQQSAGQWGSCSDFAQATQCWANPGRVTVATTSCTSNLHLSGSLIQESPHAKEVASVSGSRLIEVLCVPLKKRPCHEGSKMFGLSVVVQHKRTFHVTGPGWLEFLDQD